MKKNTILTIAIFSTLILLSPIISTAQYTIGLKGGVNFCNYGGRYITSNYESKIRGNIGAIAQFQTNSWFSVQAELSYDPKGANYSRIKTSGSLVTEEYNNFEENLQYLSLPVFAKFDIGEKNRVYGYTGLYLSYLLSASIKGEYVIYNNFDPEQREVNNVDRDYKPEIDHFDFGAVLGLGFDFTLSENYLLFLDGRFNWGWANVAAQGQGKIFNDTWSVNLGLLYKLPEKS
jgi:hypothetical protein